MSKHLPIHAIFRSSHSGQATLLAILIATAVAVVTAVGVTSRQNSSFRRTTYTTQTDQSFSCANSGVDAALLCITNEEKRGSNVDTVISTCKHLTDINLPSSGPKICSYNYDIQKLTSNPITINNLLKGQVQQYDTTGATGVSLTWKSNTAVKPGLEITYAYNEAAGPKMNKYAYNCNGVPSGVSTDGFSNATYDSGTGNCSVTINGFSPAASQSLVRIKPLFSDANTLIVNLVTTNAIPSQGLKILSHGKAGNIVRNIEVMRMNPQLPALFDYVLYSEEGSIQK